MCFGSQMVHCISSGLLLFYHCFILTLSPQVSALTRDNFFSFGPRNNDSSLPEGDDIVTSQNFPAPFFFYGKTYTSFGVATNGIISLNETFMNFTPVEFPTTGPRIAPFWGDADTTGGNGNVYYRSTMNQTQLSNASSIINTAFANSNFVPQYLTIVTWLEVGYFRAHGDKTNTFQAVLAANNESSYIIFLYEEGGIQWTTGDSNGGMNGLGGDPATVGLNAGDNMNFTNVANSHTDAVINISSTTNIGIPGMWAFQVNTAQISAPDPCLSEPCDPNCEGDGLLNGNFTCTCLPPFLIGDGFNCFVPDPCLSDSGPCDPNADCTREGMLSETFNCMCRPPFTVGDGFTCIIPDPCLSQRCHANASCIREGLLSEGFMCTCDTDCMETEDADTKTNLGMYRAVIISIPTTIGVVSLVLLFGAAAGYTIVTKKIFAQAKHPRKSTDTVNGNESLFPNPDTYTLLSSAA